MFSRRGAAICMISIALVASLPLAPAASVEAPLRHVVGFDGALPLTAEVHGGRVVARDDALGFVVVEGMDPAQARLDPRVRYVEEEHARRLLHATPNDPQFSSQYAPQKVQLPLAWDTTMGDASAAVCIVDTGARLTHQDLAAARYLGGYDFVDGDATPQDGQGHGTHVLGIAAASVDNARNISGAGNVGYYVARVLDDQGDGFFSTVAQGIQWCVDRPSPRVVISLSLGCGSSGAEASPRHGAGETCDSQPVRDAIANAFSAGRLVVASAGNEGGCYSCVSFPARIEGVMAIGCTGSTDSPCIFTSWGYELAMAAPGINILSLGHASDEATTTLSGTSMSAPLVAGAAALYWSHDHAITMPELRERVRRSSVDVSSAGWDSATGCGRLDVKRLFDGTLSTCVVPQLPPCDGSPVHDCFANATLIPFEQGPMLLNNAGATDEPDEAHPCDLGRSVWFKFTADRTETAWVYPSWTTPDGTAVAIYRANGAGIRDLELLGCSDGYPTSWGPANVQFTCVAGTTYYMQVGSLWGSVRDLDVLLDLCSTGPAPPTAPRDFAAGPGGAIGAVSLSWTEPLDDGNRTITEYRVERAPAPTGVCPSTGFTLVMSLDGSARSATQTGLTPNETLCYRLTAVNEIGESPSVLDTVFVPGLPDPPRVPAALGRIGEVRMMWQEPLHWGGVAPYAYRVYSAPDPAGPFALAAEITNLTRTYSETGLEPGTLRAFKVSAVTSLGESPPTKVVWATSAVPPTEPRNVAAASNLASPFSVRVSWLAPANSGGTPITEYQVYRDGELRARIGATEFIDRGVGAFDHHVYTVRAVNGVGPGPFGAPACGEAFPWPNAVSRGCP